MTGTFIDTIIILRLLVLPSNLVTVNGQVA